MGIIIKELVKKLGFGLVMTAIAFDCYRRTVANYNTNKKQASLRAEAAPAKAAADKATQE